MKSYKFKRHNDDGTITDEDVAREHWCWEAHYNDGSILRQFDDETGEFHQFKEIDQDNLGIFKMVHDSRPEFLLFFEPDMKLIHYYNRNILRINTPDEERFTIYYFGYERGKEKVLIGLTENCETFITNNPERISSG